MWWVCLLALMVLSFRVWTGNFFVIYPVRVDFVIAKAMPAWRCFRMTSQGVGLSPGEDFWIKVRIDGKEGWIHTQEDFIAIGLPQAG
ncbi:MAG: hypothetical protein HY651_05025 [Acidobacteria bacterium]|nr:hypothetical protein [Acidobacteriota bacterium]